VDTSPVRHTFLKFAAPNSWRLWTYHAQVWMPGDAANSACGSQKVGISTDGRAPRNSLESPQSPSPEVTCPMRRLSIQFVEQSLCLQKIRNIETLSEPGNINDRPPLGIVRVEAPRPWGSSPTAWELRLIMRKHSATFSLSVKC
jgi:hypothetical protein